MEERESTLVVGQTCWRTARARRVAFLVDAEEYYDALVLALRQARHSVLIAGWDIHSRVALRPHAAPDGNPCLLGELLAEVTAERPGLDVRLLIWDFAPVFAMERELGALMRLEWITRGRVHVEWAKDHPRGGSHHQKIVVIDDALAFTGGIDPTIHRWDDREHRVPQPARVVPSGEPYGPYHDVQVAVDGPAAAALGELVRTRWRSATGEVLAPPPGVSTPWPAALVPDVEDVELALARTQPAWEGCPSAFEVEALYRRAIASARRTLYCESQYVTSTLLRDALVARLQEPDGPEVILLTPNEQEGALERLTMGVRRNGIVGALRDADRFDRLRVLCPATLHEGVPHWVHVHSKLMVVDEDLLLVGSANLADRSLELDTECVLAFESRGVARLANAIVGFRNELLAEHCGVSTDDVERALAMKGSVRGALELLRGSPVHALLPVTFETEPPPQALEPIADVIDARRPVDEAFVRRAMTREAVAESRRRLPWALLPVLFLLLLAGAWTWTPLSSWVEPHQLSALVAPLQGHPLGPLLWVALFVLASVLMVPVTALIVVTVMLFGPWLGFATALVGSLAGAMTTYGLGRVLLQRTVRRLSGPRLDRLARRLAERGWLAIAVVRLLPVAPFAIINLVAGSSRIRPRDFLLGTLLGMAPGLIVLSLAADRVVAALRDPSPARLALATAVLVVSVLTLVGLGRLLERAWQRQGSQVTPGPT